MKSHPCWSPPDAPPSTSALTALDGRKTMPGVEGPARSGRAGRLAAQLDVAASALIAAIAQSDVDRWEHVTGPGIWSIGKDAEHVIEAIGYHEWIVRLTVGSAVSSRRPTLERSRLTTDLSRDHAIELLRRRSEEVSNLIRALTDEQLDLPTRPPRAGSATLATTVERVLIGHYGAHRDQIESKGRAVGG